MFSTFRLLAASPLPRVTLRVTASSELHRGRFDDHPTVDIFHDVVTVRDEGAARRIGQAREQPAAAGPADAASEMRDDARVAKCLGELTRPAFGSRDIAHGVHVVVAACDQPGIQVLTESRLRDTAPIRNGGRAPIASA